MPVWLRWVVGLVRLVVVVCTVQLSGGSHVAAGLLYGAETTCIDVCSSPCKDEPDDHGCPPGCPDCSCPHGRLPSLPPSLDPVLPDLLAWDAPDAWTAYASGLPPSPPLATLDRPPRA